MPALDSEKALKLMLFPVELLETLQLTVYNRICGFFWRKGGAVGRVDKEKCVIQSNIMLWSTNTSEKKKTFHNISLFRYVFFKMVVLYISLSFLS